MTLTTKTTKTGKSSSDQTVHKKRTRRASTFQGHDAPSLPDVTDAMKGRDVASHSRRYQHGSGVGDADTLADKRALVAQLAGKQPLARTSSNSRLVNKTHHQHHHHEYKPPKVPGHVTMDTTMAQALKYKDAPLQHHHHHQQQQQRRDHHGHSTHSEQPEATGETNKQKRWLSVPIFASSAAMAAVVAGICAVCTVIAINGNADTALLCASAVGTIATVGLYIVGFPVYWSRHWSVRTRKRLLWAAVSCTALLFAVCGSFAGYVPLHLYRTRTLSLAYGDTGASSDAQGALLAGAESVSYESAIKEALVDVSDVDSSFLPHVVTMLAIGVDRKGGSDPTNGDTLPDYCYGIAPVILSLDDKWIHSCVQTNGTLQATATERDATATERDATATERDATDMSQCSVAFFIDALVVGVCAEKMPGMVSSWSEAGATTDAAIFRGHGAVGASVLGYDIDLAAARDAFVERYNRVDNESTSTSRSMGIGTLVAEEYRMLKFVDNNAYERTMVITQALLWTISAIWCCLATALLIKYTPPNPQPKSRGAVAAAERRMSRPTNDVTSVSAADDMEP